MQKLTEEGFDHRKIPAQNHQQLPRTRRKSPRSTKGTGNSPVAPLNADDIDPIQPVRQQCNYIRRQQQKSQTARSTSFDPSVATATTISKMQSLRDDDVDSADGQRRCSDRTTSAAYKKHMRHISLKLSTVDQLSATSETCNTVATSTALISAKPTAISLKHRRQYDDGQSYYHQRHRSSWHGCQSCCALYPFYGQNRGASPSCDVRQKQCNCGICETTPSVAGPPSVGRMRGLRKVVSVISGENHQLFSATTSAAAAPPATSKHRPIHVFNVFLFIVILLNLTRLACGHNVNLNNSNTSSDRVIPTFQQHHQFHISQPDDEQAANKNSIRRVGGGTLNLNLGNSNGYTTTDDNGTVKTADTINTNRNDGGAATATATSSSSSSNSDGDFAASTPLFERSGCHSCQMREKVKADNLASIKRHILYRLKLTDVPNITAPVVIPPEILEKFYKVQNSPQHGSRAKNRYSGGDNNDDTSGERYSPYYDDMQGDDPRAYYDTSANGETTRSENFGGRQQMHNHYSRFGESAGAGGRGGGGGGGGDSGDEDEYEDGFFSVVNSIYVFPSALHHSRHNRKTELHFALTNNGRSTVAQATLHLFIRSWNSYGEHSTTVDTTTTTTGSSNSQQNAMPSSSQNGNAANRNNGDIVLRIYNGQRHVNLTNAQVNEVRHRIPRNNNGIWITVDVTDMVSEWYNNASTNHGIAIRPKDQWMKNLVVLDDTMANKTYTPYIEVITKDNRKRRTKRNTSLNCSESDNEIRCCRYPLEVNFRHFSWDWVIAPEKFNAYFCNGECKLGFLQKYPHTHMMQMSTAPQPCCSPTKMSSITLLYFNQEHHLVMSTIPNMAVDTCSCS